MKKSILKPNPPRLVKGYRNIIVFVMLTVIVHSSVSALSNEAFSKVPFEEKLKESHFIDIKHLKHTSVENQLWNEDGVFKHWNLKVTIKCKVNCSGRVNSKLMKFIYGSVLLDDQKSCPPPFSTAITFVDQEGSKVQSLLLHMSGLCFKYHDKYYVNLDSSINMRTDLFFF